jgi:hypothetical protein
MEDTFRLFVAFGYDSCCLVRSRRAGWRIIHAAAAGKGPVRNPHPLIVIAHESLTFVQPHLPTSTVIRAITHLGLGLLYHTRGKRSRIDRLERHATKPPESVGLSARARVGKSVKETRRVERTA